MTFICSHVATDGVFSVWAWHTALVGSEQMTLAVGAATRVACTTGPNALILQAKNGQPTVRSLSLPEIGMVLICEPALSREPVLETRASQALPVLLAKK